MKRKRRKTKEEIAKIIIRFTAIVSAIMGVVICITYHHSIKLALTASLTGALCGFGVLAVAVVILEIVKNIKGKKKDS